MQITSYIAHKSRQQVLLFDWATFTSVHLADLFFSASCSCSNVEHIPSTWQEQRTSGNPNPQSLLSRCLHHKPRKAQASSLYSCAKPFTFWQKQQFIKDSFDIHNVSPGVCCTCKLFSFISICFSRWILTWYFIVPCGLPAYHMPPWDWTSFLPS